MRTALEVGRAHTVIALQVSLENIEKSNDFYNAVEKVPSDSRSMVRKVNNILGNSKPFCI